MPSQPDNLPTVKTLIIGMSGSGKTGGVASLLKAGFHVRVIDLENGIETLVNLVKGDKEVLSRLDWITVTDPMKFAAGKPVPAKAIAWNRMVGLLENWRHTDESRAAMAAYGAEAKDLGPITSWTSRDVLVIDTLSKGADFALNYMLSMNAKLGGTPSQNEHRRNIWMVQGQYLEPFIWMLADQSVKCNVIVNSHVIYVDDPEAPPSLPGANGELTPRAQIGLPAAIGKAIGDKVPRAFNHLLLARKEGNFRFLYTKAPGTVATKTSAPNAQAQYKMDSGLAEYFKLVRGA